MTNLKGESMFLEKTDRLALVDFENNHINYKDLIDFGI